MKSSGGGVTASGGEATLQKEFVTEWFKACKLRVFTPAWIPMVLSAITMKHLMPCWIRPLVMLDIKHMNDDIHIPLTHVSNASHCLEFARYLAQKGKTMWIRYVVVPGWSDDDAGAHALGAFIRDELGGKVEKLEMLPYHELGKHKWIAMGEKYELEGVHPPKRK